MHKNTSGALISYKGHTLTADEGHALLYGFLGGLVTVSEEVTHAVSKEPHYFLAGLAIAYAIGRRLS